MARWDDVGIAWPAYSLVLENCMSSRTTRCILYDIRYNIAKKSNKQHMTFLLCCYDFDADDRRNFLFLLQFVSFRIFVFLLVSFCGSVNESEIENTGS